MAQILAPSAQWQMRIAKSSTEASPMASKMWGSVVMKPNKRLAVKSSAKFRVFALQSKNSTVNRMEQLLNLDVTPYTDKIIAEYIWELLTGVVQFVWAMIPRRMAKAIWRKHGSLCGEAEALAAQKLALKGVEVNHQE
nr:glutamine synthetase, chloroplastic [Ipomoea trifida]GMC52752.1 glutamine synthetase leaf isozyme, chloroplastic [Ipomoea batatas]GMC55668.1 glutamine synthetase leaf isozyme, chloroplastic [Ipomoea batatas]